MTWFDDGDGWRDDSTEGPIDTLKVHFASGGALEIMRYDYGQPYLIKYHGKEISRQDSVVLAKAWAEQWWKEHKNDPEAAVGKDTSDEGSCELG